MTLPINTLPKGTLIHVEDVCLRLLTDIKVEGGIPDYVLNKLDFSHATLSSDKPAKESIREEELEGWSAQNWLFRN